jgi:hypothetical protein
MGRAKIFAHMTSLPTGHRAKRVVRAWAVLLGAACSAAASSATCPPQGWTRSELLGLKAQQWTVADPSRRAALADALLDCLRDPDPVLRDEVAFEALQHWMRAPALEPDAVRAIGERLLAGLEAPDPLGFGRPFAALVLSEVIRDDRMRGLWSAAQREAALERIGGYMASITDHRGFEPGAGWRHGVAHAADALMQFALHPALDRAALDRILEAVASQVAPPDGHAYVHGESERLVRPVLFTARRGLHDARGWSAWLGRLVARDAPAPDAPTTLDALARLHNLKGFVYALYASAQESRDPAIRERLLPAVRETLRALP